MEPDAEPFRLEPESNQKFSSGFCTYLFGGWGVDNGFMTSFKKKYLIISGWAISIRNFEAMKLLRLLMKFL